MLTLAWRRSCKLTQTSNHKMAAGPSWYSCGELLLLKSLIVNLMQVSKTLERSHCKALLKCHGTCGVFANCYIGLLLPQNARPLGMRISAEVNVLSWKRANNFIIQLLQVPTAYLVAWLLCVVQAHWRTLQRCLMHRCLCSKDSVLWRQKVP